MVKEKNYECMERESEFASSYRWQHWLRAFAIVALVITGFYIADPFITESPSATPTNFLQAYMRGWHEIIGWVLIGILIFKSYLFLFAKKDKNERDSLRDAVSPSAWIQQIGYYLFLTKHPKLHGVYNPLQFAAYLLFYIMLIGICLTGVMLYVNTTHVGMGALLYKPMTELIVLFGGLANVREIHHILMWGIIIFVSIHVYMAVFNAVYGKNGSMDAIFSGVKWKKEDK